MSDQHAHGDMDGAAEWDERYSSADRLWTADVNPALIAEISDVDPGTALDVGSGEGADARWLADRGWQVIAVDISQVAIDRSRELDPREATTWLRADLTVDDVPGRDFDLVSLQYFPIARTDEATMRRIVDAVGPGGRLLMVSHEAEGVRAHGRNPDDYFQPADVAALLGDGWTIRTNETRERGVAAGGGAHTHDVVLHAHRDG
ncbi:class I SAM-dependent methyltransferase [Gordonia sp. Z-3]|jgi:SAM-dependent methyltransferase|uniref:class I SAM-dependent methyltransferase n=1 Tax=Gordonia sp. Z-3 TaxID=3115408 RepID=UPI002E2E1768|nr:class I SAM-dependent methyltransferase [Gordonia sp. Z-3]MED5803417.1 class I SAM-dependent methyltransferase [Gordonia sp. Z-3]